MYALRMLIIIALASMAVVFAGCSGKVRTTAPSDAGIAQEKQGPPDHAPAHGHRKNKGNESVVLVYDDRMDVYVVSGHDDCYYTAGQFYRKVQGAWEWSVCIDGPWKAVAQRNDLPPGLRKYKA